MNYKNCVRCDGEVDDPREWGIELDAVTLPLCSRRCRQDHDRILNNLLSTETVSHEL